MRLAAQALIQGMWASMRLAAQACINSRNVGLLLQIKQDKIFYFQQHSQYNKNIYTHNMDVWGYQRSPYRTYRAGLDFVLTKS